MTTRKQSRYHKKEKFRKFVYFPILLSSILVLSIIYFAYWAWLKLTLPTTLPFHHVNLISSYTHIKPEELQQIITEQLNGGFFSLNIKKFKQRLNKVPWVDAVAVRRIWPDILEVKIIEQQALARWGKSDIINNHGKRFCPPTGTIPQNLPLFDGPDESEILMLNQYQQLETSLAAIGLSIQELHLDQRHSWEIVLNNGLRLILGKSDIDIKLLRLVRLYKKIIGERFAEVNYIDLRYSNGIAINWKKENNDQHLLRTENMSQNLGDQN